MRLEKLIFICLILCTSSFAWDETKIQREFELLRNSAFLPEIEKEKNKDLATNSKKQRVRKEISNIPTQKIENLEARYFNDTRAKTTEELMQDKVRSQNAAPQRQRSR